MKGLVFLKKLWCRVDGELKHENFVSNYRSEKIKKNTGLKFWAVIAFRQMTKLLARSEGSSAVRKFWVKQVDKGQINGVEITKLTSQRFFFFFLLMETVSRIFPKPRASELSIQRINGARCDKTSVRLSGTSTSLIRTSKSLTQPVRGQAYFSAHKE